MTIGIGFAGHHQSGLDLPVLQQRGNRLHGIEHAAASVLQVKGQRAPALEFDVDAEPVLDEDGHGRFTDMVVAMDAGIDQQADIGLSVPRRLQAPAPRFDGVADRAPAPEMPARQADAQAFDTAMAHVNALPQNAPGNAAADRRRYRWHGR